VSLKNVMGNVSMSTWLKKSADETSSWLPGDPAKKWRRSFSYPVSGRSDVSIVNSMPGSRWKLLLLIGLIILSRVMLVTIDGSWIDNWICWIPIHNTCPHFTIYCNTHTHTHTNLLSVDAVSPVVTSQRRYFLSSRVPRLRSSGLSLYSSGPRTSCRPTHSLRTDESLSAPTQDRPPLWGLFNSN
jgi:hypothetical protein